jgi:hypothetical protein
MPQTTQYIREEDMEAWSAIANKSKWIHDHLNKDTNAYNMDVATKSTVIKNTASGVFARATTGTCKLHGTLLDINGKCTQKGHKK